MLNPRIKDLSGQLFGMATVLRFDRIKSRRAQWIIRCACGTVKSVDGGNLRIGHTLSCGCLRSETSIISGKANKTHGMSQDRTYKCWSGMIQRCRNPNDHGYKDYGGRGIKICQRWSSFENFYADMGPRPDGLSIERKNNDGDYEPSNCKWATGLEQHNNTRRSVRIEWAGKVLTLTQWARERSISKSTLWGRIKKGWSISDALQANSGTL